MLSTRQISVLVFLFFLNLLVVAALIVISQPVDDVNVVVPTLIPALDEAVVVSHSTNGSDTGGIHDNADLEGVLSNGINAQNGVADRIEVNPLSELVAGHEDVDRAVQPALPVNEDESVVGSTAPDAQSASELSSDQDISVTQPLDPVGVMENAGTLPSDPPPPSTYRAVSEDPVPNRAILHIAPNTLDEDIAAYVASFDGEIVERIPALNTLVVDLPDGIELASLPQSQLATIEPDYYVMMQMSIPPNDPFYSEQWALKALGLEDAWARIADDLPKVMVAVIDSGICLNHADLEGHISEGYDFTDDDSVPQDELGHGCAVSGIIAANINNGIGISGIAPNAMLMPLRVLDDQGVGTYSRCGGCNGLCNGSRC